MIVTMLRAAARRCAGALCAGLALSGCSAATAASRGAAVPSGPAAHDTAGLVSEHPAFRPVVPPPSYQAAVAARTRSADGRPGPRYWQQWVRYRIQASLDTATGTLRGREEVTYLNRSPDTLSILNLHLYQNIFAPGVPRDRTVTLTGGIMLDSVGAGGYRLDGLATGPARDRPGSQAGYSVSGTLARLRLPRALAPGDSVELGFRWHFRVPGEGTFRTGSIGHRLFAVAQWYPQVAVYDDVQGFDATPYLGDGEFYLEYGSFDVSLTLPAGWLVAATGTLENGPQVLRSKALRRLASARSSDSVIAVVDSADARAGRATTHGSAEGTLTWHFVADSVRDFAFSTSSRYVWDAVGAHVGGKRGRVRVDALYDPSLGNWADAARFEKHALEFYSRYILPYPYPHASAAFGPVPGMEYPMLVFIGRSGPGQALYGVLAHELSHEWFPMLVGSREAAYAWMDEGLTTFDESLASADMFGEQSARSRDMSRYLRAAALEVEAPLMQHTEHVEDPFGRVVAAYSKPATVLHALRHVLGAATFDRGYRAYARAWSYRHPLPWDFFAMMEDAAGRDLDWFWRPWFYETVTLDQAVDSVTPTDDGIEVTIANLGGAVLPVLLRIRTTDGAIHSETIPAQAWAGRSIIRRRCRVAGQVSRVEIDPEAYFPDVDRANNIWQRKG